MAYDKTLAARIDELVKDKSLYSKENVGCMRYSLDRYFASVRTKPKK
jgi:hypothetical protein